MSQLSDAVLRLEQENEALKRRRPFGNIVLRKRDGFERGIEMDVSGYGPYTQLAEIARYSEMDYRGPCRPDDRCGIPTTTYHNTRLHDTWGRQVLEEV